MKITDVKLENFVLPYPLEKLCDPQKTIFMDIETTGFTAKTSQLYLIGIAYQSAGSYRIRQWFAEKKEEEAELLSQFFSFISNYQYLIHFNGNNFDLPYLKSKTEQLQLPYSFDAYTGFDLYKRISSYRFFLKLPNCKQKTLEAFLELPREDLYSGGDLINLYHDYLSSPSEYAETTLLLHNFEDIKGMLNILPILSYIEIFDTGVKIKSVQANTYKTITGDERKELIMSVKLPSPIPKAISNNTGLCYFKINQQEGQIRVPIYEEEMKFFYANYKDYYYLPVEDVALHKSVGGFVDKEYRQQASASNCYTRKYSTYLPQRNVLIEPFYKRDYHSKELFFELTDEIKQDRDLFTKYANHILKEILSTY